MAAKSKQHFEDQISSRGFINVNTWTDKPNAYYEPHKHETASTILVVEGQLAILFPKDEDPQKVILKPGDVVDIDVGRLHEVWIGEEGCTTVNGDTPR